MVNSILPQDQQIRQYINEVTRHYPDDRHDNKDYQNEIPTKEEMQQKRESYKKHCLIFQEIAKNKRKNQKIKTVVKKYDQFVTSKQKHRIPIRFYQLDDCLPDRIAIYLHGGGFIVGDLDTHDDICADLCRYSNISICAVDYRLSPENIYPAALFDCLDVFVFLKEKYKHIVLAGDSAGAMLVAQLCLMNRDEKIGNIKAQVLIYAALGGDLKSGSYKTMKNAPLLSTADCYRFYHLLKGEQNLMNDPYFSPLRAKKFNNLPPAAIFAAGLDPLRDDSIIYAQKLQKNGTEVRLRVDQQLVHAYIRAKDTASIAFDAMIDIAKNINRLAK